VVQKKRCNIDYACSSCAYDQVLRGVALENSRLRENGQQPKGKRGQILFWKEKMAERPFWWRPCIHSMKGRISFRGCNVDYNCNACEFDQYFADQFTVHTTVEPVDVLTVDGFRVPQGYYFHEGHSWMKVEEGGAVRVGLDDFAVRLFGTLDGIKAPLMGKRVARGRGDTTIHRDGQTAQVLSPVTGIVTAINPKVREQGNLVAGDPYGKGWIMQLHCDHLREDLKDLMMGVDAGAFLKSEADRLFEVINEEAGPLAADGGSLGQDIYGNMKELGWRRLVNLFLRT
jgi:glycine cleavage system H lipoate-binding protein